MKQSVAPICLVAVLALWCGSVQAACDPALMYFTVKAAVLRKEPSTEAEFAKLMSSIGLTQDQHVWKCETASGASMGAFFMGAPKRWVMMTYTPSKAEKIPDAILSVLAKIGRAEVVGPRVVRFYMRSNEADIAALGSSAQVDEYITVTLAGGEHEETGCTIKLGVRPSAKKQ